MNDLDLYWLAGILEGEGCFSKGTSKTPNRVAITVVMTDKDIVDRVAKLFNVNWVLKINRGDYKTQWRTQLRGAKAIKLMHLILPIMGLRRQDKIKEIIQSYDPDLFKKKHTKISDEIISQIFIDSHLPGNTLQLVASKYNVSTVTVSHVKRRMIRTQVTQYL